MDYNKRFSGHQYQRGGGLGNVLGGLIKTAMQQPWLASGLKRLTPHLLRMGGSVLSDVVKGRNIKKSLKRRGVRAGGDLLKDIGTSLVSNVKQRGGGKRLRKQPKKRVIKRRKATVHIRKVKRRNRTQSRNQRKRKVRRKTTKRKKSSPRKRSKSNFSDKKFDDIFQ